MATISETGYGNSKNCSEDMTAMDRAISLAFSVDRGLPSKRIRPCCASSTLLIRRNNVVFPEPLGPIKERKLPAGISRLTPRMTVWPRYPNLKFSSLSVKTPPPVACCAAGK